MKSIPIIKLLLLLPVFFISSCKKKSTPDNIIDPGNIIYTTVKVAGLITDNSGNPLENALVKFGNSSINSNAFGQFEIESLVASNKNPVILVEKPGFFKGSRAFIQQEGKNYVRIALLPRLTPGVINSSTGGNIITPAGLQLKFPANAFSDMNGAAYTGNVNVFTAYICPDSASFNHQMPGWLQGKDSSNTVFVLQSVGMAAIEIETPAGNPLKITSGKKINFALPILPSQQSVATAEIPLWYWSDSAGYWIKEGNAKRSSNLYAGDIGHFSTWNFDFARPPVRLKAKFVTPNGTPIPQKIVEISAGNNLTDYTHTNETGKINLLVVKNAALVLSLKDDCGQVIYSRNLGSLATDTDLGTITISALPPTLTIKGKLVDCNNAPIASGKIYVQILTSRYIGFTNASGDFEIQMIGCLAVNEIKLTGVNIITNEQNTPQIIPVNNQSVINTGNIIACKNAGDEFIQIIRNKDTLNYRYPECSTIFGAYSKPYSTIDSSRTNIYALPPGTMFYSGIIMNHVPATFTAPGTMYIYNVNITSADSIPSYDPVYPSRPKMNITEYGAVGEYIAGNFAGKLFRNSVTYDFKISFRVKRTQ